MEAVSEFAAHVALSDQQCCNREKREAKSTARLRISKRDPCCHHAEGCDQHPVPSVKLHDGIAAEPRRSEEHTSELQSLMRISYAVFCLKKKTTYIPTNGTHIC